MWLFFTRTYLGTEAVAVLIKNKIHAALGKARFFIKIAAALGFLATGRTDRHLFLPAKIFLFIAVENRYEMLQF